MAPPRKNSNSKPDFQPLFKPGKKIDDRSSHAHRQAIGWLGLSLPFLVWFFDGARQTPEFPGWLKTWPSISAYFYSGGGPVFVGVLFALVVFLFTYQGYKNEAMYLDRLAGAVSGMAAFGVLLCPTQPPDVIKPPTWWTDPMGCYHIDSAFALFGSFAFFALVLFRWDGKVKDLFTLPPKKKWRDWVYLLCGFMMLVFMGLAYMYQKKNGHIFWPETGALVFFGISWLIKGEVGWTLAETGKRIVHYGSYPIKAWTGSSGR